MKAEQNVVEYESLNEAIEKERNILLGINGLKEVVLLDATDRKNIFSCAKANSLQKISNKFNPTLEV